MRDARSEYYSENSRRKLRCKTRTSFRENSDIIKHGTFVSATNMAGGRQFRTVISAVSSTAVQ
jgi:hypothetical protein